jgi:hypothetical protein
MLLASEAKRNAHEREVQRTRQFESARNASPMPGADRRERNRQLNETHLDENRAAFDKRIDEAKQRRVERDEKARHALEVRAATLAAEAERVHEAEAVRKVEIASMMEDGPAEGVRVSTSQLSARERARLADEIRDSQRKLDAKRQQWSDEQVR